jgi:hypothetical protein
MTKNLRSKTILVVSIELLMAAIFVFRIGTNFDGYAYEFYYSYSADFIVPFGFYFLLYVNETSYPFLRNWRMKAAIIIAGATLAEIGQGFGLYVFGKTFDPVDVIFYAIGAMSAVVVDVLVFPRIFSFWQTDFDEVLPTSESGQK